MDNSVLSTYALMVFCEPFQGQGWHRFRFLLSVRQSITNEPMVDLC